MRARLSRFASSAKLSSTRATAPPGPSARRRAGFAISVSSARASASASFSSTSSAGLAVAHQLRDRRDAGRHAGERLALRLGEHVRQAVAVAVARDAAREREQIGVPVFAQQLVLRERAAPLNAVRDAEGTTPGARGAASAARRPTCTNRQCSAGGNARQRLEQHIGAFLLHQASHRQDHDRVGGIATIALRMRSCSWKPLEVDAVVHELDLPRRRERGEVIAICPRCR